VLGWDKAKQNGTFAESFIDQNKGKSITNSRRPGRRVVMPVAGAPARHRRRREGSGGKVRSSGFRPGGCKSAAQYATSSDTVVKNINDAVSRPSSRGRGQSSRPRPGYLGTLATTASRRAPYNQFDSKIDATLKSEVDSMKQAIISATVKVESAKRAAVRCARSVFSGRRAAAGGHSRLAALCSVLVTVLTLPRTTRFRRSAETRNCAASPALRRPGGQLSHRHTVEPGEVHALLARTAPASRR